VTQQRFDACPGFSRDFRGQVRVSGEAFTQLLLAQTDNDKLAVRPAADETGRFS
jgi:hypothetical protein